MLIRTLWTLSIQTRAILRRWMPTNILLVSSAVNSLQ